MASSATLDRLLDGNFHVSVVVALCNGDGLLTGNGSGYIETSGLLHDLRDSRMPELVRCPKWDLLILRQTFISSIDRSFDCPVVGVSIVTIPVFTSGLLCVTLFPLDLRGLDFGFPSCLRKHHLCGFGEPRGVGRTFLVHITFLSTVRPPKLDWGGLWVKTTTR